eukprot:CAMPEP_0176474220 /NCGR_PEP_ID=MMETSP0127-20121128/42855_1 /TAXON_ID=938130 /ORGANISM="Platyophrya macrostoma, Strain WH" /LENGTH=67 /DNA_ID=CAMNT_0017869531 /DNA_START=30 /DNA_END=229 /DNA_ORIENTATION=+
MTSTLDITTVSIDVNAATPSSHPPQPLQTMLAVPPCCSTTMSQTHSQSPLSSPSRPGSRDCSICLMP